VVRGWSIGTLTYLGIVFFFLVVQFQTYYIQRNHIIKTVVNLFTYKHLHSVYGTYHCFSLETQKDSPITTENCILHRFKMSFRMSEQRIWGTCNIISWRWNQQMHMNV